MGAQAQAEFAVGDHAFRYCSLAAATPDAARLPYTLKIVLENLLRQRVSGIGAADDIATLLTWRERGRASRGIRFMPARVMMDDTAGLPLIGDLAAMRDAAARLGADPERIAPVIPVDFIVDHSIIADHAGSAQALARNMALESARNAERFSLLRWGGHVFDKLRVVPPGGGICHQINLEYLARVVRVHNVGSHDLVYPDTMVGIDSHTPMIGGLGVLGWGVSGMEGLAAALGEPVTMPVPEVVGCRLHGRLGPGVTATDFVLTMTQLLRRHDVVGKFVEYFGAGLGSLTLADRATVANMSPEAGATLSYFPIDEETLRYLRATGRDAAHIALIEAYAKTQGLWHDANGGVADYSAILDIDLAAIDASVAGPLQPHERVPLRDAPRAFRALHAERAEVAAAPLKDGDVVIAAITSCTNTSNPAGMVTAGLVARNAVARGLTVRPWVKTSLSPGSRVVADYLANSGLQHALDALGFQVTGYGCMTCVGFSGPLAAPVAAAIDAYGVAAAAVLSGNRNYAGRVHAQAAASFLASPPLVVAYALAGSILTDLTREPLGADRDGRAVYLRDVWPDDDEVRAVIDSAIVPAMFTHSYATIYAGAADWRELQYQRGTRFEWNAASTVIRLPPLFDAVAMTSEPLADIRGARVLAIFGDLITTEHVSPMGLIPPDSPAGLYLQSLGVAPADFVSFAARRLNHDVMIRGALASSHLRNEMTPGRPGGVTLHMPTGDLLSIFEAAQRYLRDAVPLVVVAGRSYGTGSSRDWSAKGVRLLGVRAVIAESFERIHRANLVAAGVLPLQFTNGQTRRSLRLDGNEALDIAGVAQMTGPSEVMRCTVTRVDGSRDTCDLVARMDTQQEVEYFRHGGILNYVLRQKCQGQTA